jgi:hypothetical protein
VLGTVMREFNLPFVSATSTTPVLSDKAAYPTFSRVVPSDSAQGRRQPLLPSYCHSRGAASSPLRHLRLTTLCLSCCSVRLSGVVLARLVASFGWTRVAIAVSTDSYGSNLVTLCNARTDLDVLLTADWVFLVSFVLFRLRCSLASASG